MTVHIRSDISAESVTYFLLHLVGFLSLLFFAPYLMRLFRGETETIEYINYFSRMGWVLLMSIVVGGSLVGLGFIAIGSVVALFDLSALVAEDKWYGDWASIALASIAPLYALSHLPHLGEIEKRTYEINRFFSFLIRYIAVPFICIYFLILYAYSVKVLIHFSDWPKGMICWMVIGFSTFGYITYIFSKPYSEEGNIVRLFRRYFPLAVIPQLAMLAYAISLRISQYDLTMNRYFVVIFGLWLLGISLYLTISRRQSLAIITASLTLLSLLISIWPWSVFSFPFARQETRLMQYLETAKILQDGKIVPLKSERDISKELSTDIASGIEYLCNFDDCARIKEIFPDQVLIAEAKYNKEWESYNNTGTTYPWAYPYQIQSTIESELRVQRYPYDDEKREFPEEEYLNYNIDYQKWQYPLDVKGYDMILQVISTDQKRVYPDNRDYPYVIYDATTESLSYYTASGVVQSYPLTISEKLRDSATISPVMPSDLTFVLSDKEREIRLILQSLMVKNPNYTGTKASDVYRETASGFALIRKKQ
jgi:hypothetical protein